MAIEITGSSGMVKYKNDEISKQVLFSRNDVSASRVGNKMQIIANDYREEFDFEEVTIPLVANSGLLLDAINDLI